MQTDNDIRLQLGIINGESLKLQSEVSPMGWMHPGVPPNWNSRLLLMRDFPVLSLDVRHPNLVIYGLLLFSLVSICLLLMTVY